MRLAYIILSVFFSTIAFSQITITVPSETPVTFTGNADSPKLIAQEIPNRGQGTCGSGITLSGGVDNVSTSFTLINLDKSPVICLSVGNGIIIDNETSLVVSISPLIVQRARLFTSATTHAKDAPVIITREGSQSWFVRNLIADGVAGIVQPNKAPPTGTTLKTAYDALIAAQVAYNIAIKATQQ